MFTLGLVEDHHIVALVKSPELYRFHTERIPVVPKTAETGTVAVGWKPGRTFRRTGVKVMVEDTETHLYTRSR